MKNKYIVCWYDKIDFDNKEKEYDTIEEALNYAKILMYDTSIINLYITKISYIPIIENGEVLMV